MQSKRTLGQVQTPGRNGFASKGVFCVYFEDGVHFSQKEESQQVGRQRVHTPLMVIADIYISISMGTFGHRKYKSRGEDGNK